MQTKEVISAMGQRWSRVTASQGGWMVRFGLEQLCASECFFLDEQLAHGAAERWKREGVEPRGPETLVGLGPVSP